jgi:hypothetical protein
MAYKKKSFRLIYPAEFKLPDNLYTQGWSIDISRDTDEYRSYRHYKIFLKACKFTGKTITRGHVYGGQLKRERTGRFIAPVIEHGYINGVLMCRTKTTYYPAAATMERKRKKNETNIPSQV